MNKWADLWESHVKAGKSPADATALVQAAQQAEQPSAPTRPTIQRQPSESTVTPATHPKDVTGLRNEWPGLIRAGVQGASFGFGDEIEAGARSALGPRSYRDVRDDIRASNDQFSRDNPLTSAAANVVGGIVTGSALAKARGVGGIIRAAMPGGNASLIRRVGAGAASGFVAGGIGGAGAAKEMGDVVPGAATGMAVGAATGGLLSAGLEALRGVRNGIGAMGSGEVGTIRRAIRQDTPEQAGIRRVLTDAGRAGKSVDDLAQWSKTADAPDMLFEGMGQRGNRAVGTARGLGHTAPDDIENTLVRRGRDEVGRVRRVAREQLGDPVDAVQLRADKLKEAQTAAGPLYTQAIDGVKITDPRVVEMLKKPSLRRAYEDAVKMAADDGVDMPLAQAVTSGAKQKAAANPVTIPGQRRPPDLENVTLHELEKARRGVSKLDKLSGDELDAELAYMRQQHSQDYALYQPAEGAQMAEYHGLRSAGMHEDARGIAQQMGYDDPNDFARMARDAGAAEKRMRDREPLIAKVEAEMARRKAQIGDVPHDAVPDAYEPRTIPGQRDVTLPDAGDAPTLPTVDAKHVQYWKHAMDDQITALEGKSGGTSTKKYAQLVRLRNQLDDLIDEHANKADDGASLWGKANTTYAKPMQERDAFANGRKVGRTLDPADVPRLLADPNAEYQAKGVASTIHKDLARLGDGSNGTTRNPGPVVSNSAQADARLQVATRGDASKQKAIQDAAGNAGRRLKNSNDVLRGSQTAEKLADQAMAMGIDPAELVRAASSPAGLIARTVGKGVDIVRRQVVGRELDAASKYLMAGGPNQMAREQAIQKLREMEPELRAQLQRQLIRRAAVSGTAAQAAGRP